MTTGVLTFLFTLPENGWLTGAALSPDGMSAQHVAQAATALHPTDAAAQRWQHEQRQVLYLGQVDKITTPSTKPT